MLISIIITNYNNQCFVRKCIDSVLHQSYKNIELVIVEDCSTDESLQVIQNILDNEEYNIPITLVKNKYNVGAGRSRDIGIKYCTGDYIMFIDSDDYILDTYIENLVSYTKDNWDIIGSPYIIDSGNGNLDAKDHVDYPLQDNLRFKFASKCRSLAGILIKSSLFEKVQYSHRRYIEDTPTLFKLIWFSKKVILTRHTGYVYYQNASSLCHTASPVKKLLYRVATANELYNFCLYNNDIERANIFERELDRLLEGKSKLSIGIDKTGAVPAIDIKNL